MQKQQLAALWMAAGLALGVASSHAAPLPPSSLPKAAKAPLPPQPNTLDVAAIDPGADPTVVAPPPPPAVQSQESLLGKTPWADPKIYGDRPTQVAVTKPPKWKTAV